MKIEELLQKILDIAMTDDVTDQTQIQSAEDNEPTGVFMPPLQTSIELMKKATGTDNVIDDEEECADSDGYEDEWHELADTDEADPLIAIRRNAGLFQDEEEPAHAVVFAQPAIGPGF